MRALVLVMLLIGSHAEASPAWYEQFYIYSGYREVTGLARASGRTLAVGYREERDGWGLDLAAFDHVDGFDEGLHALARLTAFKSWHSFWVGGGVSYGVVDGWVETTVPHRSGSGLGVDAVAGVDLSRWKFVRPFIQLDVTLPTFSAVDRYGATDSSVRVFGVELAIGLRL